MITAGGKAFSDLETTDLLPRRGALLNVEVKILNWRPGTARHDTAPQISGLANFATKNIILAIVKNEIYRKIQGFWLAYGIDLDRKFSFLFFRAELSNYPNSE